MGPQSFGFYLLFQKIVQFCFLTSDHKESRLLAAMDKAASDRNQNVSFLDENRVCHKLFWGTLMINYIIY